jgi:hypothetical protein
VYSIQYYVIKLVIINSLFTFTVYIWSICCYTVKVNGGLVYWRNVTWPRSRTHVSEVFSCLMESSYTGIVHDWKALNSCYQKINGPIYFYPTKITLTIKNSSLGVLDTTLCDKVCQWFATGQWFSPSTPVFSTNKTDRYIINMQTHHSITTAYKLVPGIFHRIILLKKMLCCAMEMKLGCKGRWFMDLKKKRANVLSFLLASHWFPPHTNIWIIRPQWHPISRFAHLIYAKLKRTK